MHCDDLEEKLKGRHFELDWERAPQPLEVLFVVCNYLPRAVTQSLAFSSNRTSNAPDALLDLPNAAHSLTGWLLQLEIHSLRGIRDKIPKGYYVLRMAMYDQVRAAAGLTACLTELRLFAHKRACCSGSI